MRRLPGLLAGAMSDKPVIGTIAFGPPFEDAEVLDAEYIHPDSWTGLQARLADREAEIICLRSDLARLRGVLEGMAEAIGEMLKKGKP